MKGLRFFEPDNKMIAWLRSYIGDRVPVDVGCGECDLLIELGKKGIGIDPYTEVDGLELLMKKGIHFMPMKIQESGCFISALGSKAIMIFARPCHSTFVEEGIDMAPEGMEVLYITKPSNVNNYCDLGKYDDSKKLLKHSGKGKENEIIYSIKK